MAQPIAGTTLTHAAAIVAALGGEGARSFFEAAIRNRVKVVAGNALAKDLVVDGEASWCLTDTDDALKGVAEDSALAIVVPDQGAGGSGALLIPGSVALIAGAPHGAAARQLIDFLLNRETTEAMLEAGAFQVPLRADSTAPRAEFRQPPVRYRRVDWEAVLQRLEETQRLLSDLFVR
jgi:iron(III) transport system substrate-binding protein